MKPVFRSCIGPVAFLLIAVVNGPATAAESVADRVQQPVRQSIDTRQATQQTEDQWELEKEKLQAKYRDLVHANSQLEEQSDALSARIDGLTEQIDSNRQKLKNITDLTSGMAPFLGQLLASLKTLVEGDTPFLMEERRQRVSRLEKTYADPDISLSEKYRKIMEAFFVEAEYGNTIELYPQTVELGGRKLEVTVFRLGRLSLFCQSLDQSAAGYFDVAEEKWRSLPEKYNPAIHTAIEIAAKRRPVEIIDLPLGRMAAP